MKPEVEGHSRKGQKSKRKKKRAEKEFKEKLKVSLRKGKERQCKNEFRAKGLRNLSVSLFLFPPPPFSTPYPVRFLQLWAGSQDLFLFCHF